MEYMSFRNFYNTGRPKNISAEKIVKNLKMLNNLKKKCLILEL